MRLIDADELSKTIKETCLLAKPWDYVLIEQTIADAPTIEPEVTEEAVKEYCRKRCLCIVDSALLKKYASAQPEIIRCKDCKWYGRVDKRRFYRGMDCLQKHIDTIVPDRDFCSKAERRGEQDG